MATVISVSVVIAAYNAADFIAESLDSVMAQTYPASEIIVIDDGSTDHTQEVVRRYGDRVRYVSQQRQGPAAARNHGIALATGDIIAFQDADDIWTLTKLERQVHLLAARPDVAMVMAGHRLRGATGELRTRVGTNKRQLLLTGDPVQNIFLHSGVATPSVVIRREVLQQVGLFEEGLRIAEDDNMWMRVASGHSIDAIDDVLVTIRIHDRSLTRDFEHLVASVEQHIEILGAKYPQILQRIRPVIPMRMSALYFALGEQRFSESNYQQARAAFRRGLALRPKQSRYRMYAWLCLMPENVLDVLRSARRLIRRNLRMSPRA